MDPHSSGIYWEKMPIWNSDTHYWHYRNSSFKSEISLPSDLKFWTPIALFCIHKIGVQGNQQVPEKLPLMRFTIRILRYWGFILYQAVIEVGWTSSREPMTFLEVSPFLNILLRFLLTYRLNTNKFNKFMFDSMKI